MKKRITAKRKRKREKPVACACKQQTFKMAQGRMFPRAKTVARSKNVFVAKGGIIDSSVKVTSRNTFFSTLKNRCTKGKVRTGPGQEKLTQQPGQRCNLQVDADEDANLADLNHLIPNTPSAREGQI